MGDDILDIFYNLQPGLEDLKTNVEDLIRYLDEDEVRYYSDDISYKEVIDILERVLKKLDDITI